MKGYDQKPPSHRAFLDYHRFLFKNSHYEIISDSTRYTKHSISSKIKPHKTISIISSSVSQESSGMNFSLAYSEIANKSCEVSSFKESYFDFKDEKPNKSMQERRDYQRMNQSAPHIDPSIYMRKNAKIQKAYQGDYILKNLDDDQFEQKYLAEIDYQKRQKQKQKQQQKKILPQGIESQLNQSKTSMISQSQKDLKSVKETSSNNTSELNLKSELFLSNASEKKTQQLIPDQEKPSSTIQEKTFGQSNEHYQSKFNDFDSKEESLISSEKAINMKNKQAENLNLKKIKSLKTNGAGNPIAKKQSSDDDSNQSFEDVRKSYEQKEKMPTQNAKDNSGSSDEQEDFYSRIQTTINKTMSKSIYQQQNQNLYKWNSSLVEKTSNNQEQLVEDSFHTIKNNQTILSNGSQKQESSTKTQVTKIQQFQNRITSNSHQKVETMIKKDQNTEIRNQDQQYFLKTNQEENALGPFQANKQDKFATKSTQRLPQAKKSDSSQSQASFEEDNSDQSDESYEKNISKNIGEDASKIKISSDNIAEKIHKTEEQIKSKDYEVSEEKEKSNANRPSTKSKNQISNGEQVELIQEKRKKKLQSQRNRRKQNSSEESWTSSQGEYQGYQIIYKTNVQKNNNLLKIIDHDKSQQIKPQVQPQKQVGQSDKNICKRQQSTQDGVFSLKKQLGDFLLAHQKDLKIQAQSDQNNIDQSHSLPTNQEFTKNQGQYESQQNPINVLKQSQTGKKLDEELFDGKNQKLDGERISYQIDSQQKGADKRQILAKETQNMFQKSQMQQVTKGCAQKQKKQTKKIQPGDTKQLLKQTQNAENSFRQRLYSNKEDQEWFIESLSEKLTKSLRKQFSEELKSQKELFYYQLKDNLLQQITDKFVNLKNQLSVQNNQRQNFVQRQVHVSINPSINEYSNLHKQNQAITSQKDPIIKQESKDRLLNQQLKQVIQQQIAKQIVPLVKQVKSILHQQIQSLFKTSLSTILKDQLIQAVKQELTPAIKSEITESIRNQISQSLRSQIYLALKDDIKRSLKDQFKQNWKKASGFMRSQMNLPPKQQEIPKQHVVTDRKQQVSEIESKITIKHDQTEKNQELQNQKNVMQQVNRHQESIGIKNQGQDERMDGKQFQGRKSSSSASSESIDDGSHPELSQPGQKINDMRQSPANQENTEQNTAYEYHSQNERNENTQNRNTDEHKEDSVQESDSNKSFEVEEDPLQNGHFRAAYH